MTPTRVFLLLVATTTAVGCSTRTDFVLPEGFRGPALVVFDDPLGEDVKTLGWKHEEYRLGADGVLRLRTPSVDRFVKSRYFFESRSGKRTEISESAGDDVHILNVIVSRVPRHETPTPLPNGGSSSTNEGGFGLVTFVVGTSADYPVPIEVELAFQEKVMHEEYARLAAAGR
jgi:hypothetical protein